MVRQQGLSPSRRRQRRILCHGAKFHQQTTVGSFQCALDVPIDTGLLAGDLALREHQSLLCRGSCCELCAPQWQPRSLFPHAGCVTSMTRGIETLQNSHVQHAPCGGVEHAGNAHQASKLALPSISSPPTNSRRSHMLLVEDRAAEPINAQGTSRRVHTTSMQRNAA